MLVVVLPEAESLDSEFQTNARCNIASTEMCHETDWSNWLCMLDMAVFANLLLSIPIMRVNTLSETLLWNAISRRSLTAESLSNS